MLFQERQEHQHHLEVAFKGLWVIEKGKERKIREEPMKKNVCKKRPVFRAGIAGSTSPRKAGEEEEKKVKRALAKEGQPRTPQAAFPSLSPPNHYHPDEIESGQSALFTSMIHDYKPPSVFLAQFSLSQWVLSANIINFKTSCLFSNE